MALVTHTGMGRRGEKARQKIGGVLRSKRSTGVCSLSEAPGEDSNVMRIIAFGRRQTPMRVWDRADVLGRPEGIRDRVVNLTWSVNLTAPRQRFASRPPGGGGLRVFKYAGWLPKLDGGCYLAFQLLADLNPPPGGEIRKQ